MADRSLPTAKCVGNLGILGIVAFGALIIHLAAGSSEPGQPFLLRMSPMDVLQHLFAGPDGGADADPFHHIVWQIRLPRALACVFVGALLGSVGSAFQALFRNPLAEPYIVGVSSGAAAGGAMALVLGLGAWAFGMGILFFAFLGGAGSLMLVLAIAGRRGRTDVHTLLLSGVVVGAMLASVLSLILYSAGADANQILRWMLGSATPMHWNRVAVLAIVFLAGALVLFPQGKRLNALAVSDETAQRLGVDTKKLKRSVLTAGTAMTAVAVGSVGVIGFLGLVAPHIARRILGIDWRWSMSGAAICGAAILVLADVLAQRVLPGGEVPVGVITAILGAPFLLVLLRREGS